MRSQELRRMRFESAQLACLTFLVASGVPGCSPEVRPAVFTGDFCLNDLSDLTSVTETIKSLAASQGMTVHDRSLAASGELRQIATESPNSPDWYSKPVLMLTVDNVSGSGMTATNAGLNNQIAVTIFGGRDHNEAQEFATLALSRLRAQWDVREQSLGSSISPDKRCALLSR